MCQSGKSIRKSQLIMRFMRCLTWYAVQCNFSVLVEHISGINNPIADNLSPLPSAFCSNVVLIVPYSPFGLLVLKALPELLTLLACASTKSRPGSAV